MPRLDRLSGPALAVLALLLMRATASAQLLTAANVPISITSGTEVTVEGAVLLNASSAITNQGDLRVQGNWTNNSGATGITPASGGNVRLYGGIQSIGGTSVTDFRRLITTGGSKQLLQDAVVGLPGQMDGTVQLGALLALQGRTFTVFNPSSTAVSHTGGWVASESLPSRFQWALGNDVSEHMVLFGEPLGPAIPFGFTPAAPYANGTLLSVATYRSAPNNTPYPITANQQVTNMAGAVALDNSPNTADRFWLVDLPNGNFTGTLRLSFAPAEDPQFGPGNCRAQRWLETGTTWQYPPLPGQSNPALREVLVPNVLFNESIAPTNEHIWALAYDYSPLPISLLRFGAEAVDNRTVQCTWTTVSEQDNDFFTVERSKDGLTFEDVGAVDGAGTTFATQHYTFDDARPYAGLSFYRLRQTDFDGTATWSQAVPVVITASADLVVFPNPNRGQFTIQRSESSDDLDLLLLDGAGRTVRSWRMSVGVDRINVEEDLANGMYTLRWKGGQVKVSVGR